MKKYIKLLCVCLLTVFMCLSFCSCKELDEMRDDRAVWGKTEQTVYFRKAEYKLLPACEDLNLVPGGHGYITESDVPVQLSSNFGTDMSYDRDAVFIVSGWWQNKPECNKVWCRADKYDEMCAAIDSYVMNRYCIYDPQFEDGYHYEKFTSVYTLLPEEVSDIVNAALATEGIKYNEYGKWVEYDKWNEYDYYTEYNIYVCDESLRFVGEQSVRLVRDSDGEIVLLKSIGEEWYKYSISTESAERLVDIISDAYSR